ncbi:MAG: hypothetical protein M0R40_11420, partial [Firmicutes bacterium]|nr:hypothetical protein [Bacillota bacterium]
RNMSSDNIPFSSPRKPRKVIESGIENPQNLFAAGDKLGYIAGGKLYYDGNIVKDGNGNDVAVGETSAIVDFNGNVVMYPSNVVYDYVNNKAEAVKTTYPATKQEGYYEGEAGTFKTGTSSVLVQVKGTAISYYSCMFALKFNGVEHIDTSSINRLTINATGLTDLPNGVERNLYIVGYDSSDKIITWFFRGDSYLKKGIGYVIKTTKYSKIKVMVGYNKGREGNAPARNTDFNGNAVFWYEREGTYPATGIPAIQHATVDNNRIFAATGNNIYVSSQGSYSDWTNFADVEGNPNPVGSYREDLDTPQDITGIIKYKGNVVILKPDLVYESFGNKPPYRIVEVAKTGCIDGRSVVEVNSVLYWLGRKGIYAYTGGQPRNISEKLNKTFENGIAGTDGRKYYISAYDGDKWELYVYDTYSGLWHIEDNKQFVGLAYADGHMHGLAKDGNVYKFGGGDERVEWEFKTQDFTFGMPNKKTLSKIYIRVQMARYSDLDIYIKKDNGGFERKATYHANEFTTFDFKAKIKKFDSFALMFKGMGDVRILDIHGDVTVGTAKHKHGDLSVFRG